MKVNSRYLDWVIFQTPEGGTLLRQHHLHISPGMTGFTMLYTEPGLINAKNWFYSNATGPSGTFTEALFMKAIKSLTDFNEAECLDIFDLFDKDGRGLVSFNDFFLILSLLAARESGQCTKFLHKHGRAIFDLISQSPSTSYTGSTTEITFEGFARFGFVLGVSEIEIMAMLVPFEISLFDSIDYDKFEYCYCYILAAYDKKKNAMNEDMNSAPYMPALSTTSSDYSSKYGDDENNHNDKKCCCVIT